MMSVALAADKENFQATRKKLKAALRRLEARSGQAPPGEPREVEARKAELLAYLKQYEALRYCKWMQAYCAVMDAQLSYHRDAIQRLQNLQSLWAGLAERRPETLPLDTWTQYIEDKERELRPGGSAISARRDDASPRERPPAPALLAQLQQPQPQSQAPAPPASSQPQAQSTSQSQPQPQPQAQQPQPEPDPQLQLQPQGQAQTEAPAAQTQSQAQAAGVLALAPKPRPGSPWKLYATDDGDDYYYFNEETGESVWELPPVRAPRVPVRGCAFSCLCSRPPAGGTRQFLTA